MTWNITGKSILITGAARGIGAESARQLSKAGAKVSLVGLEPEGLAHVAAQCGPDAIWIECDVTDSSSLEDAVAQTVESFGGIDVCIANAGISVGGPLRHSELEHYERAIEINLLGAIRTISACLPHVIERRGYVLPVASLAAVLNYPGMGAYCASKAGVEAFANSLRSEVKHLGVDVGVCYFSFIDTDMVVAGVDAHPGLSKSRSSIPGPFGKIYPVAAVGKAIRRGIERRQRWVTVPGWVRLVLLNRGWLWAFGDRTAARHAEELDARFADDVATRGREAASSPVGPGGAAARERARERG